MSEDGRRRRVSLALWRLCGCLALGLGVVAGAAAQTGTPLALFQRFTGPLDFASAAGTFRNAGNGEFPDSACSLSGTASSARVAGLPGGATVRAAYLYWAGSGTTPDNTVLLDGASVVAQRTFTASFPFDGVTYDFFSGFADVTARVGASVALGDTEFAVDGLSVETDPHCNVSIVLAGWGLLVIYEDAAEPLRVVSVYDGFDVFRESALAVALGGFETPAAGVDGRLAYLTWEGDVENSGSLGGFDERLRFNGTELNDGSQPTPDNPFNSTWNQANASGVWGVDFDVFDVAAQLTPGATSATSVYESGADLVLLSLQAFSVTNVPIADLGVSKSHANDLVLGANTYDIDVTNAGPSANDGAITVVDTLPAGLTFAGARGTNWTCTALGQDVTCTHPGPLAAGAAAPRLELDVIATPAALPRVSNTVTVRGSEIDENPANDTATRVSDVFVPDVGASTKSVLDPNGGNAEVGDVLRFTIAVRETNSRAASGLTVRDDIPASVTGFTVVSIPPGAVDASSGAGTGANGNGLLNVTGIDVPAGGVAEVVFEVRVANVAAGTVIANVATVTNPNGPGATPASPDVIVSDPGAPAAGNKPLYLYSTPASSLSRTPPPPGQPPVELQANATASRTWTLAQVTRAPITLDARGGAVGVALWLDRGIASPNGVARTVTVALAAGGQALGTPVTRTVTLTGTAQAFAFDVALAADRTLPAGSTVTLTVTNAGVGGAELLRVLPSAPGGNSQVVLPSRNVISVDDLGVFDAAFPGGARIASAAPGATVFVRAAVSDPFGSFDIAAALLSIADAGGTALLNEAPMALVADSGLAERTYERAFTVPGGRGAGTWPLRVRANEGTEGTVSHVLPGALAVGTPLLRIDKTSRTESDPVNGTLNPKAIPGARVRYTLSARNQGFGPGEAVSLTDAVPAGTDLFVGDLDGGGAPLVFVPGASGLSLRFGGLGDAGDDVDFADAGGFGYVPNPDAQGFDPAVRQVRVTPSGRFEGGAGGTGFDVEFRVRLR